MLDGPAGTGKSRVCLEKLNALAEKYAGCRLAIVRKFRAALTETALVTFEQHVKPRCNLTNQQRNVRQSYRYPNASEIIVAGIDNPVKLMSAEFDAIYVQEATELTVNDWEFLSTRLRNGVIPYQQLFGDCNPGPPSHWLNKRMEAGLTLRVLSRHEDNPRLFDSKGMLTPFGESYIARLDKLTGPRKLRLRYGKWAAAEGMVYASFDAARHVIASFPIPSTWRRFIAIDFGYTNPFVCQWWAIDPDGRMYLYRELYRTQRTVQMHAQQIRALTGSEVIEAYVTDHDTEDRATLEAALGIRTRPADKAVSVGIQSVEERLKLQGDGKPRLFIFADALVERDPLLVDEETGLSSLPTCTLEEIDGYVWAKGAGGETLKENPVKQNDHGMDDLRYATRYADGFGKRPERRQDSSTVSNY
ncbi:phage terminase large subunit [Deinococcus sp. KNUC1210]|uniref:phage terminase large subunit n=1 Tax=Deinococcus sp. KNUC1210 TaxID=2917691 RepID=UPI001EEFAB96|nr:phage terminase large subunit [Deinococcus sp. KNUC1210]ULH15995.1 phage terminase large subunit [Deinococcus sp. KNUC1210]